MTWPSIVNAPKPSKPNAILLRVLAGGLLEAGSVE
jgi:hypothetical protein